MKKKSLLVFLMLVNAFLTFSQYTHTELNASRKLDSAMIKLHKLLDSSGALKKNVDSVFTLVHFGDSHIQGDHFSGEIRRILQGHFGDAGQGLFFPYSLCKSWGPKGIKATTVGNWSYSQTLKPDLKNKVGLSGYQLSASNNLSAINFLFNENFKHSPSRGIKIWYKATSSSIDFHLDNKFILDKNLTFNSSWGVRSYQSSEEIKGFELSVSNENINSDVFSFFGFELFNAASIGINYHHCGVVGAQFTHLIDNSDLILEQLAYLKPDVLVFSFGTNEAYGNIDTTKYFKSISNFMDQLEQLLPKTAIIITTAPDTRSQGKVPPSQISVNKQLLKLKSNHDISVFDLNQAMGGWGSLDNWYKSKLVLDDKLHFSATGYALQGKMFALGFLSEYNKSKSSAPIDVISLKSEIEKVIIPVLTSTSIISEEEVKPLVVKTIVKPLKSKVYIVKKGDTISKIARKYHLSTDKLLKMNNLKENDIIRVGQKIKIP